MCSYNNLLERISKELNIKKGTKESENSYKARIIYSAVGRQGYASLLDNSDAGLTNKDTAISVQHLKTRMARLFSSFFNMYPDIARLYLDDEINELIDEMYSNMLYGGYLLHKSHRLAPCLPQVASDGKICLTRGLPLSKKQYTSGLGTFMVGDLNDYPHKTIGEMFNLESKTLAKFFEYLESKADWKKADYDGKIQYHVNKGPFKYGYWSDNPVNDGEISLLRIGNNSADFRYYLYRYTESKELLVSALPGWMFYHKHAYRDISNSILSMRKTLPPTEYKVDGPVVYLSIQYLYPLNDLNLIKLYSWPGHDFIRTSDFKRVMDKDIFMLIKKELETKEYMFNEVH